MNKDSKIFVAGHLGMVGSAIVRGLQSQGFENLLLRKRAELDLERQSDVETFFESQRPDYVFLAAAKVGGIRANNTCPADFIYSNLIIQTIILHTAWKTNVKQLLFLGSSCVYPRHSPQPIKEEYMLTGTLEPTNEAYAIAKIAGIKMCHAYNRQHHTRFIPVMPTNLYGPNDNYDLLTSHALPALIRKFHLGKLAQKGDWQNISKDESTYGAIPDGFRAALISISKHNAHEPPAQWTIAHQPPSPSIPLWGTGKPLREFLHVDDLADACLFIMNRGNAVFDSAVDSRTAPLINIGVGKDTTIKDLARTVQDIVGYSGNVHWDTTKPDGTPRKVLDTSIINHMGWRPTLSLSKGIQSTYKQYTDRYMH